VFRKVLRIVRALVIALIYVAAVCALYYTFRDFSWAQFRADIQERSFFGWRLAAGVALVALNYVFLFGYDFLAIRYVGRPLPFRRLWLASFIGHVSSFNFGAILGGSSMRYRFYSAWGFTTLEVLQLIAVLGITFWMGVMLLAGVIFITAPLEVPPNVLAGIPDWLRPAVMPFLHHLPLFGAVLLAVVVGYVLLCWMRRQPLNIFGSQIPLPPPMMTIGQLAVSCADLMVASTILWLLLKSPGDVPYLQCLGIFLLAMVLSVITHVPGGIGILEATVVFFLPGEHSAVLLYRGVYYLLPLAVAGVLLLGFEIVVGREFLKRLAEAPSAERAGPGLGADPDLTPSVAEAGELHGKLDKPNGEPALSQPDGVHAPSPRMPH
jgi:uncharacterized membrane protein YbhN (UPF0104 family)